MDARAVIRSGVSEERRTHPSKIGGALPRRRYGEGQGGSERRIINS